MALEYRIAPLTVDFDNTYTNVVRFDDIGAQRSYFNIPNIFKDAPYVNFNAGNGLTTTVVFNYKYSGIDRITLLNKNYLIVEKPRWEHDLEHAFYFITNTNFEVATQVTFTLELDVFQTYYMGATFSECLIKRAHLNRFIPVADDHTAVQFDYRTSSNLFLPDGREHAKYMKARHAICPVISDAETESDKNVLRCAHLWAYYFLKPKQEGYTYKTSTGATRKLENSTLFNGYTVPYVVLCAPISVFPMLAKFENGKEIVLSYFAVDAFLNAVGGGGDNVYGLKLSTQPPFQNTFNEELVSSTGVVSVGGNDRAMECIFITQEAFGADFGFIALTETTTTQPMVAVDSEYVPIAPPLAQQKFKKSNIIGAQHAMEFNPKLLSTNFMEYRISNASNIFSYDPQKYVLTPESANKAKHIAKHSEVTFPDITRYYTRLISNNNDSFYNTLSTNNYVGLVGSNDCSIPWSVNAWDTYLNANKNYYTQATLRAVTKTTRAAANAIGGTASAILNPIKAAGVAATAFADATEIMNTAIDEMRLTPDNMQSAPEQIHNVNGNVSLQDVIDNAQTYFEIMDCSEHEKRIDDSMMNLFGYTLNAIDQPKKYDNVRFFHNYIQCVIDNVSHPNGLSNAVRNKFRAIFQRGVRMWNVTDEMYKYEKENYERWLIE